MPVTEEQKWSAYPGCYALSKVLEEVMLEQYYIQCKHLRTRTLPPRCLFQVQAKYRLVAVPFFDLLLVVRNLVWSQKKFGQR